MKKLKLSLESCYGIRRLEATLDFSRGRNVAVYASNGTMKSSLARVFKDARDGGSPRDRIYDVPGRHKILCDGEPIAPASILVFDPDDAKDEAQTSAGILVNETLRTEYNAIISGMNDDLAPLVRRLNKLSGVVKNSIPSVMLADFGMAGQPDDRIYELLLGHADDRIYELLLGHADGGTAQFKDPASINYAQVFNADTEKLFKDPKFRKLVGRYIRSYKKLVSLSRFLQGRFDQHAATDVQKSLDKSGLFDAGHAIVFHPKSGRSDKAVEVRDTKEYSSIIESEKSAIQKDLDSDWMDMEKMLARTANLDTLRLLLSENQWLISLLDDTKVLGKILWTSYLALERGLVEDVCEKYEQGKERLDEIIKEAKSEKILWGSIVGEFMRRFHVPFSVKITNQAEALLGIKVPALEFTYSGADGRKEVERGLLKAALSNGERRALYILNMLFEVQKQIDSGRETVVVIDDLVDSFDYKNKYAIVHYLKEVLDRPNFYMVILTHNFDFLRIVKMRGIVDGRQVYFVDKKDPKTTLLPAKIPDSPLDALVSDLDNPARLIASVPFARNIVEYTRGTADADYLELTRLLHWRDGTDQTTVGTLLEILGRVFPKAVLPDRRKGLGYDGVFDAIICTANDCSKARGEISLGEKIVLSVAARLLAERFLVNRLLGGRAPPVKERHSIHEWIAEHRRGAEARAAGEGRPLAEQESKELEVLDDVALMTPEAIHINSFMYEPILDMPADSLICLYKAVRDLDGGCAPA